jgi:hypothetical protein
VERGRVWRTGWKAAIAAMAAVVALATPAAAQEPSATTVQAVPANAAVGESVTLQATVTCSNDPSGGFGMTFADGSEILDTVPVSPDGTARYTTTFETAGSHTITAIYSGNSGCFSSNSTTTVQVSDSPVPPTPPAAPCNCGGLYNIYIHQE